MELGGIFNCNGKVNSNDWILNKSTNLFLKNEIENVIFTSHENSSCFLGAVRLFNKVLPSATAILNLKHLTACLEMELKLFSRCRRYKNILRPKINQPDFCTARKNVCECLVYIRSYLRSIKWNAELIQNVHDRIEKDFNDLLIVIKKYLGELRRINDAVFHYAGSNLPVEHLRPEFHMYHLHLELRWLGMTLLHAKMFSESYPSQIHLINDGLHSLDDAGFTGENSHLDAAVAAVIDDLIYVAAKLFESIASEKKLQNLRSKTPYSCTCIRELWLMLQIFIDNLAMSKKLRTFWQYVNISLDAKIGETENMTSTSSNKTMGTHSLVYKNPEMFCIWLLYHLAILYGYNFEGIYTGVASARVQPNYMQIEKILKVYVQKGGKAGERDEIDEELREMIPMLTTLICKWWQPQVQIVSLLWDCFHRRLDQPFFLQTMGPWMTSAYVKGPGDILKCVKQRLDDNSEYHKSMPSYGMFLRLLGTLLHKSIAENDLKCWNQMKGRIYSKFTKNKVEEFSETGLYNFISLFLTLALTTNSLEVCTMMLELLPSVLTDGQDPKKRILIWKGELAVLLLFTNQKINFEKISNRFLNEVDALSCRKDETSQLMITLYIDVLDEIFMSSERMELSEHRFIGGWIDRYFLECPKHKVKKLILVLNRVFGKCIDLRSSISEINFAASGPGQIVEAIWKHVAGRVRMLVLDEQNYSDHYQSLSELAVKFTLEALKEPDIADRYQQKFISLFKHFSSSLMIRDIRLIQSYLTLILLNEDAIRELKIQVKNFDTLIIQAWIKCSIIKCNTENDEINYLTRYVLNTDEIIQLLPNKSELITIENSKEPILSFIRSIMKQSQKLQTEHERFFLGTKCREYFTHIEKWALLSVMKETKETNLSNWIYQCIGTLISCCSPILYFKNQPGNMLMVVVNRFMLPPDKSIQIISLGKRIFSMIISGIGNLNVKSDLSLQLLMKNLFDYYLPHLIKDTSKFESCKISDELLKCFYNNNDDYLRLIFEKLAMNFIVSRNGITHEHCYLVMILLKSLIRRGKSDGPHIIDIIISVCLPEIITCYMNVRDLHSYKQQTIDLISDLVMSPYYKEGQARRERIKQTIISTVQKYLKTSKIFFEFVISVCRIIPDITALFLLEIENTMSELEAKKYPNVRALRFSIYQLQKSLQSMGYEVK